MSIFKVVSVAEYTHLSLKPKHRFSRDEAHIYEQLIDQLSSNFVARSKIECHSI